MLAALVQAQETLTIPQAGGGAIVVWVILAAGFIGLYVLISRTRKRSYRAYMARSDREAELRANDPDLKKPEES